MRIENGRWRILKREERIRKNCRNGEVENVEHLVMRCEQVKEERGKLMELMDERVEEWQGMENESRVQSTGEGGAVGGKFLPQTLKLSLQRFPKCNLK